MTYNLPTYDYSFINKLNSTLYKDLNDLIEAFKGNIEGSILTLANSLFEKGLKYFLIQNNVIDEFFNSDPSLSQMIFSPKFYKCKEYITSRIKINCDVLGKVKQAANSKKHSLNESEIKLRNVSILNEIFSMFVQIHNYFYSPKVKKPSKEYVEYIASFNQYNEQKIQEVNDKIEQSENIVNNLDNEIEEKSSKLEDMEISLTNKNLEIIEKEKEVRKLDSYIEKKKREKYLTEYSKNTEKLYQTAEKFLIKRDFDAALRMFNSILNSNLTDLRAFTGVILAKYESSNLDELLLNAQRTKKHLKDEPYFEDIKFLENEDQKFILDLAKQIDISILYGCIDNEIINENFAGASKYVAELEILDPTIDLSETKDLIKNEPNYLIANRLLDNKKYEEAIPILERLGSYKDSSYILFNTKELIARIEQEKENIRIKKEEEQKKLEAKRKRAIKQEATEQYQFYLKKGDFKSALSVAKNISTTKQNFALNCVKLNSLYRRLLEDEISYNNFEYKFNKFSEEVRNCVSKFHPSNKALSESMSAREEAKAQKNYIDKQLNKNSKKGVIEAYNYYKYVRKSKYNAKFIDDILKVYDSLLEKSGFDFILDTYKVCDQFYEHAIRACKSFLMPNFDDITLNQILNIDIKEFSCLKEFALNELNRREEIKLSKIAKVKEPVISKKRKNIKEKVAKKEESKKEDDSFESIDATIVDAKSLREALDKTLGSENREILVNKYILSGNYDFANPDLETLNYKVDGRNKYFDEYQDIEKAYIDKIDSLNSVYENRRKLYLKSKKRELLIPLFFYLSMFLLSIICMSITAEFYFYTPFDTSLMTLLFTFEAMFSFYSFIFLCFTISDCRLLKNKCYKLNEDFDSQNKYLKDDINHLVYSYKKALYFGYKLSNEEELKLKTELEYPVYEKYKPSIFRIVSFVIITTLSIGTVSSYNIYFYNKVLNDIHDFDSESISKMNYAINNIDSNFKDFSNIKAEYNDLKSDIYKVHGYIRGFNHTAPDFKDKEYLKKKTNIKYDEKLTTAHKNLQFFTNKNANLHHYNVENTRGRNFGPLLNGVNYFYFLNNLTLHTKNGDGYLFLSTTGYKSNLRYQSDYPFSYSYSFGKLELGNYYRATNQFGYRYWSYENIWTLTKLRFISENKGVVFAENDNGFSDYLEFNLLEK